MDVGTILRLRQAWNTFTANHPKVPAFVNQVKEKNFVPGTEIAIAIRYPDGTEAKTGIRVKPSDLALLDTLKSMMGNEKP